MKVPLLDLREQYKTIKEEVLETAEELFESQYFILGPRVASLEKEDRHIYNQFVIRVKERRDDLRGFLNDAEIGTEVYYPVPMHLQDCFSDLGYKKGDFPEAEYAALHTLALPIYPELSDDQMAYVVDKIKAFYLKKN
jgi:dTDP-4-amino-4,6-dideoxygalactose transaminase